MDKNSIFLPVGSVPTHRSIQAGAKRFVAPMITMLTVILLGVLVTSCSISISSGPPSQPTQPPSANSTQPGSRITPPQTGPTGSPIRDGETVPAGTVVIIRLIDRSHKSIDVSAKILTESTKFGVLDANTERDGWMNYPSLDYAKGDACRQAKRDLAFVQTPGSGYEGYSVTLEGGPVPSVC